MNSFGLQDEAFEMRTKNFSKGMRQKLGLAIAGRVGFMKKGKLVMLKTSQGLEGEDLTELTIQYMEEREI